MNPLCYLDYGALGAAILVLLVAVAVLFRVLMWVREILDLVLSRVQANTQALTVLATRLEGHAELDDLARGIFHLHAEPGSGFSGREEP
jgi:hypothetical protein